MKQRVMLFQTARQGLSRVLETAECGKLGLASSPSPASMASPAVFVPCTTACSSSIGKLVSASNAFYQRRYV